MLQIADYATTAARLDSIREQLGDLLAEAAAILPAGPIRDGARDWLGHLDRALGIEPDTTIDDTIAELLALAAERHQP